jgi:hypothetical protein
MPNALLKQGVSKLCTLALGIVLAGPGAAYGTERPVSPAHSRRTIHHRAVVRDAPSSAPAIDPRAEVPSAARPWSYPANHHETDGLSRNPEDCALRLRGQRRRLRQHGGGLSRRRELHRKRSRFANVSQTRRAFRAAHSEDDRS